MGSNRIDQLISQGELKMALEVAKKAFKRDKSPDAKADLIRVYMLRVGQLFSQKEKVAAMELLKSLGDKFPEIKALCDERILARKFEGKPFDNLLQELLSSENDPDRATIIKNQIAKSIVRPSDITLSSVLPADHQLKIEAKLVTDALKAVTSGKNPEKSLEELKIIGRDSVFASWRRAIQAIHSFHQFDDESALSHASRIPADQPVAKIATALRVILSAEPMPTDRHLRESIIQLREKVRGQSIRAKLTDIFSNLDKLRLKTARTKAVKVLEKIRENHPEKLEQVCRELARALTRNISGKAFSAGTQVLCGFADQYLVDIWAGVGLIESRPKTSCTLLLRAVYETGITQLSDREKAWVLKRAARALENLDENLPAAATGAMLPTIQKCGCSPVDLYTESLRLFEDSDTAAALVRAMLFEDLPASAIEKRIKEWAKLVPDSIEPLNVLLGLQMKSKMHDKALETIDLIRNLEPHEPSLSLTEPLVCFHLWEKAASERDRKQAERFKDRISGRLSTDSPIWWYYQLYSWELSELLDTADPLASCCFPPETPDSVKQIAAFNMNSFHKDRLFPKVSIGKDENIADVFRCLSKLSIGAYCLERKFFLSCLDFQKLYPRLLEAKLETELLKEICKAAALNGERSALFIFSEIGLNRSGMGNYIFLFYRGLAWQEKDVERCLKASRAARHLASQMGDVGFTKFIDQTIEKTVYKELMTPEVLLFGGAGCSFDQIGQVSPDEIPQILNTEKKTRLSEFLKRKAKPSFMDDLLDKLTGGWF